jgi:hypothetical protein
MKDSHSIPSLVEDVLTGSRDVMNTVPRVLRKNNVDSEKSVSAYTIDIVRERVSYRRYFQCGVD